MPVRIDPTILRQIIRPALAVRKGGDCHIEIGSDTIRLRATSKDKTVYLDHSLPRPETQPPVNDDIGSFWLRLERIENFLTVDTSAEVTITFPSETSDSMVILQSNGLTYRFSPLIQQYRLFDDPSNEPVTEFSIQHGAFDQSVQVANLVGEAMRLRIAPDTRHIEFSSNAQGDGDTFLYSLSTEQITIIDGTSSSFTVPIDRLRAVTPLIPNASTASFQLTTNCLVYHVNYPVEGAQLTMYIAERLGRLPK